MKDINDICKYYIDSIKECDEKIEKLKSNKAELERRMKERMKEAVHCKKCDIYFEKRQELLTVTSDSRYELVYSDCGYGDDDEYAEVCYSVFSYKCPHCNNLIEHNRYKTGQGQSKRRWE